MRSETIDKFLDECGIHIGPYSIEVIDFDDVRINAKSEFMNGICSIGECYSPENGNLFAASREMFKALIESTLFIEKIMYDVKPNLWSDATSQGYKSYESGKSSILSALPGKTWEEIKKTTGGVG